MVRDPKVKKKIREAAEAEERAFYGRRATAEWLADLAPLGTGSHKPFLETAREAEAQNRMFDRPNC